MLKTSSVFTSLALGCLLQANAIADTQYPNGLYAVQFSEDGRYLATGGSAGSQLFRDQSFGGGIKIWDLQEKKLVKSFGQLSELHHIFGEDNNRVTRKQKGITNFQDIVFNGSFPNGKVVLLPSSLGKQDQSDIRAPAFIGASYGIQDSLSNPISFNHGMTGSTKCGYSTKGAYDFIGPMVASDNGRFAAVVVNTCETGAATSATNTRDSQYHSSLFVIDLNDNHVVNSFSNIDSGVYGVGISNNGSRVVYVGANHFQAIDVADGKQHLIAKYENEIFTMPQSFSALYLSEDGKNLISLRHVYNIDTGVEQKLTWKNEQVEKARQIGGLKVSRNQNFFVVVIPNKGSLAFSDKGTAFAKGAGDEVLVMDAKTGKATTLAMSDKGEASFSHCVTDISPDNSKVAVACNQGRVRIFDAASGKVVWQQNDIGQGEPHQNNSTFIQAMLNPNQYW